MYTRNKTILKLRTLICAVMLLGMATSTTQAILGFESRTTTPSPTPTTNQNVHVSCQLQMQRAQKLLTTKQLVVEGITHQAVGHVSHEINDCAYRAKRNDITRDPQAYTLAAKTQLEMLTSQLLGLTTENEKSTVGALAPLIVGSDLSLIHNKNNEILTFLEINRRDQHGFVHRMLLNNYTLVGLPVVATTLAYLYRADLRGIMPAIREGFTALSRGTINANEVARQVGSAIKEIPNLESTKQLVGAAKGAYAVTQSERQRKNIALGALALASAALLQDTYRHVPSRGEEARTRGTYAPSRLSSYINNSMRFSIETSHYDNGVTCGSCHDLHGDHDPTVGNHLLKEDAHKLLSYLQYGCLVFFALHPLFLSCQYYTPN